MPDITAVINSTLTEWRQAWAAKGIAAEAHPGVGDDLRDRLLANIKAAEEAEKRGFEAVAERKAEEDAKATDQPVDQPVDVVFGSDEPRHGRRR